jgi:nucleotide-binding universal stress UspA family protein
MKKILIAFDGLKYDHAVVDYAIDIAKGSDALLVAVFLHDLSYLALAYTYRWGTSSNINFQADPSDEAKIKTNAIIFVDRCARENVRFKVHVDRGVPVEDLLNETAFADLLIIDARLAFSRVSGNELSAQLLEVLAETHCPIMVVPADYEKIDNAILMYDGTPTSTTAMKMYSYLFPEWKDKPTTLLAVNEEDKHLKEKQYTLELVHEHFTNANIKVLKGAERNDIITYLKDTANNSIIVMGAYNRSVFSMLFKKSLANAVISKVMVPVLIAHP